MRFCGESTHIFHMFGKHCIGYNMFPVMFPRCLRLVRKPRGQLLLWVFLQMCQHLLQVVPVWNQDSSMKNIFVDNRSILCTQVRKQRCISSFSQVCQKITSILRRFHEMRRETSVLPLFKREFLNQPAMFWNLITISIKAQFTIFKIWIYSNICVYIYIYTL